MDRKLDPDHAPNPVDVHVGLQVRLRRKELKISQEKLAETLGLSAVHVNRTLQELRREKLITFEGGTLTIENLGKLMDEHRSDK